MTQTACSLLSVNHVQYVSLPLTVHRSGVSLAVRDNEGSFVSTLSMWLYSVSVYLQHITARSTQCTSIGYEAIVLCL